jgi:hypothetical protein
MYVDEVNSASEKYRLQQIRHADLTSTVKESEGEFVFEILGPLLLALALAVRITKVSGEIANARRRQTPWAR